MEYPASGKEGQRSFGTSITSDPVWDFRGGLHGQLFGCAGIQCRRHPYTAPVGLDLGLVSGGLLGLSVLVGSRLGALGAVAQITGAVLLILLGAGKLAGSWLRSLAARLAEQGPYTFSAWDLRFMLSVYADPTRADADRSGDLTVREAALLAAVLSVDGIATGLGRVRVLELAWLAVPVAVLCSLLAVVAGQCSGHLLRQKASVTPDSLGAALLVLMGLIRLAGQAT